MKKRNKRRGSALIVVVVVMAILGIAVAGAVTPLIYEAESASLRIETTRAFYAAESGAAVIIQAEVGGVEAPSAGDSVAIGGSTIRYLQIPSDGVNAIVEGASGTAVRRIELAFE